MNTRFIPADIEEIVSEPRFFLQGIDIERRQLVYVEAFGADQVAAQNQDIEQQYIGELNQVIDWYNSRLMSTRSLE